MPVFENRGTYLLVHKFEKYQLQTFEGYLMDIKNQCGRENLNAVCADLRDIPENLSILSRYEIGKAVAAILGPDIKMAAINNPEKLNPMGEDTAVNRGARLKLFSDMENALAWLAAP